MRKFLIGILGNLESLISISILLLILLAPQVFPPAFLSFFGIKSTLQAQNTATYGTVVTSLSTTLTTAVSGTSFALPGGSASVITWSVTYSGGDPSAVSNILEGSLDNSTFFTIGTSTAIAGDLQTTGFTAIKFVRCSQVSKTGAGTTTCKLTAQRGFNLTNVTAGSAGFADGTSGAPSIYSTSNPTNGFFFPSSTVISPTTNLTLLSGKLITTANVINLFNKTALGTTSTSALNFVNSTAAAAGAQQYSPQNCWTGQGWKTTATAASESVTYCIEARPIQGTTDPTGSFVLTVSINGAAAVTVGSWSSAGAFNSTGSVVSGSNVQVGGKLLDSSGNTILASSTSPTISSGFGTTPSITGHVHAFRITVGSGGDTSGVVAFGTTFTNAPACSANNETTANLTRVTPTTTGATIAGVMVAADKISVSCSGF